LRRRARERACPRAKLANLVGAAAGADPPLDGTWIAYVIIDQDRELAPSADGR